MVNIYQLSLEKITKLLTHLLYITTKALVLQGIFAFFTHFFEICTLFYTKKVPFLPRYLSLGGLRLGGRSITFVKGCSFDLLSQNINVGEGGSSTSRLFAVTVISFAGFQESIHSLFDIFRKFMELFGLCIKKSLQFQTADSSVIYFICFLHSSLYYNPRISFFFASNSSSVKAPISKSSLYFFNSSAAFGLEPKPDATDFVFSMT